MIPQTRAIYCPDCDLSIPIESVVDGAEDVCRRRDCYLRSPIARNRLCTRLAAEADLLAERDMAVTDLMAQGFRRG
jgi:hypothetical protein